MATLSIPGTKYFLYDIFKTISPLNHSYLAMINYIDNEDLSAYEALIENILGKETYTSVLQWACNQAEHHKPKLTQILKTLSLYAERKRIEAILDTLDATENNMQIKSSFQQYHAHKIIIDETLSKLDQDCLKKTATIPLEQHETSAPNVFISLGK